MLAVARALARDLKLLLLDEPYEGLAPVIVQEIERILMEIKELGITTIIVEQNAVAALQLADRALILDMGQIVYEGSAKEVLDNEDLASRIFGDLTFFAHESRCGFVLSQDACGMLDFAARADAYPDQACISQRVDTTV